MSRAVVVKVLTASPSDVSGLDEVRAQGWDDRSIRAVVGKTEGNGLVNDFSRELAARAWEAALPHRPITIMSGGTEGVLSPQMTLLAQVEDDETSDLGALAIGVAESEVIAPAQLGRRPQSDAVAEAVLAACSLAQIKPSQVALALVKCPLLPGDEIASADARQEILVTRDSYESMAYSRGASALGVALAVGELNSADVDRGLEGDTGVWSAVASTSAGREVKRCHVVVLGPSEHARGHLRATNTVMKDALDASSILDVLEVVNAGKGRVIQVFAKAEADPSGAIRGRRHTMLTDSDIHSTRHARAAVGGLLAGLVGDPAIYVSGGAEHQGPPGGGSVTVVWSGDHEGSQRV
jgi:cyanuric acid amidohydrolase